MGTVIAGVVIFGALIWGTVAFQRSLDKPGGRASMAGFSDALGNLIDVFDPAQARAEREKAHERHRGAVTPSPDDDLDRPVVIETNPDGSLRRAILRRPAAPGGDAE